MRVFISSDMEGTAGITDWSQCRPPGPEYEMGRRLLLDEVNAAIAGARSGGATDVVVNDSHGAMANLDPGALVGARYLSGRHKPRYMMEGLDASFDAIFFVSYHGSMDSAGVLSHTYNPRAVHGVRLNGDVVGEAGVNTLVALALGVPPVLVTGDDVTVAETKAVLPAIESVTVKVAHSRFAAESLPPTDACAAIRAAAERAVRHPRPTAPWAAVTPPFVLAVEWRTADLAAQAATLAGIRRAQGRVTEIEDDDPLAVFDRFVNAIYLTRGLAAAE